MRNNLRLWRALLAMPVFFTGSCMENIDIDTGEELPIVVECVMEMDSVQTLRLFKVRKMYDKKAEPITDAKVELLKQSDNAGEYQKVAGFHHVEGHEWECGYTPEYGAGYKLEITLPDGKKLTATTTFPEDLRLVIQEKTLKDESGILDRYSDFTTCQMYSAQLAVGTMASYNDFTIYGKYSGIHRFLPDYEPFKFYRPATWMGCKMWIFSGSCLKNMV